MDLKDLPKANWPDVSDMYKVVQIDIDGNPYLRFGDSKSYHATILREFLTLLEIPFEFTEDDNPRPQPTGERYIAKGMGLAEIDAEEKSAHFWFRSSDYDIDIDHDHMKAIQALYPDWTIECD